MVLLGSCGALERETEGEVEVKGRWGVEREGVCWLGLAFLRYSYSDGFHRSVE